jgi:hypothetical protein
VTLRARVQRRVANPPVLKSPIRIHKYAYVDHSTKWVAGAYLVDKSWTGDTYSQLVDWLDGRPNLAKVRVAGSNPVFRSKWKRRSGTLSRVPDCFLGEGRALGLFSGGCVLRRGLVLVDELAEQIGLNAEGWRESPSRCERVLNREFRASCDLPPQWCGGRCREPSSRCSR